jgi:hypothetical protein
MRNADPIASSNPIAPRLATILAGLMLLASAAAASSWHPSQSPAHDQSRNGFLERANRALQDGNYRQTHDLVQQGLEQFPGDAALEALASLATVQANEESRRLVEHGLETFFDNPGVSCRAWMRLLQIDPDDQNATRNVEVLSRRLDEKLDRLERAAEVSIEAGDWKNAMRQATALAESECLYKRSAPLIERIDSSYRQAVTQKLDLITQQVQRGDCSQGQQLEEIAGETLLSRQQTAKTYLLIATCALRADDGSRARASLHNALSFDPELQPPEWLDTGVQALLREIQISP